ncbi:membrane protein [Rhodopirellula maiorica SM1]|uniref:Membrane protein n=1 Tax=Rhodopirellula maiorica SM1 TaxID=1265738 RepID=M5RVD6_9BACT|nr:membrane protein [Rhodopirellula maiorica]EMI17919.1 membrane protein [Rhodopirellula maiorica SM1]
MIISNSAINPYEPPRSDPAVENPLAFDDELRTFERLDFQTELTRGDIREGIARTNIRTDLVSMRTLASIVIFFCFYIGFLSLVASPNSTVALLLSIPIVITAALLWVRYRALNRAVKLNAHRCGAIHGYIDRDLMMIVHPDQTRWLKMEHLVSVGQSRNVLTLCFDATQMQFDVLPLRAFADRNLAMMLAKRLCQLRPPCPIQYIDPRRQVLADDVPACSPDENAAFFAGGIYADDIRDTVLGRRWRWGLVRFALLFGSVAISLIVGWFYFVGFTWFGILVGVILLFVLSKPARSVIKARQATFSNTDPLLMSSGWFDATGQFSMATTGQSKANWSLFETAEITDRMIQLKIKGCDMYHLVARRQCSDDASWQAACDFVKQYGPQAVP